MKKITWQFLKEFSIPAISAVAYVLFADRWPSTSGGRQWIKDFGLAFSL